MSLRILHVLDHSIPLHSGYAFRTRAIIDVQHALGWETEHLTGPKQGPASASVEQVDGLRFFRTPPLRGLWRLPLLSHLGVIRAIERRLEAVARETRPDIIHAHSPPLNGVAAVRVARRLGLPCVYEVRAFWEDAAVDHGTTREGSLRYRLTRALETWVLRRADAVTCICEGLRKEIIARGVDPARVEVIPNAVDAERFAEDPPRDEQLAADLGMDGRPVIGFVGSFYAYEGLDLALEAVGLMRRDGVQVCLLLVGGGPQDANLRARAEVLGLGNAVIFTGRIPHADVARYYGLIDVLVYPRRSMRLTDLVTPLKPLEAMAQRRLLVASDVGGHRELIRDGETGLLFRAGDPEDLARNVRALLADESRWPGLRQRGRTFVEQERSWSVSVARYEPVYRGLLGERRPS